MYNGRGNRRDNNRGLPPRDPRYGTNSQGRDSGLDNMSRPLMSEQLNLRALDIELALLKQKREIIEQQQEMLSQNQYGSRNRQGQSNYYDQQGMFENQPSTVQGFSQYYDEPRPRDHAVKRRAVSVWDNAPEPKRFGSDMSSGHSRRRDFFNSSTQNRGRPASRHGHRRQIPPNKMVTKPSFNPTKVTKPKPNPALKTIKSAPIADRKNLISNASTFTEDLILYEDESKTSNKALGRLELALGVILKEVKTLYGDKVPPLSTPGLRAIKSDIRSRMRKVMVGKEVTTTTAIMEQYRKVYSRKTNADILQSGIAVMNGPVSKVDNLAIQIFEKGRPGMYFRNNFTRLLSLKLDQMFDNLRKLYKPDDRNIIDIMQEILEQQDMQLMLKDIEKITQDLNESRTAEKEKTDETKTNEETIKKTDEAAKTDEVSKTDEAAKTDEGSKTDEALKTNEVSKTDEAPNTDEVPKSDEAPKSDDASKTDQESKTDEETKEDNDVSIIDTTPQEAVIDLDEVVDKDLNESNEKDGKIDLTENSDKNVIKDNQNMNCVLKEKTRVYQLNYYNKLVDTLLNSKLPQVIWKYKKVIMDQILTANVDYKNTLAYILVETKKREKRREIAIARNIAEQNEAKQIEAAKYFVKIFGRPRLPERNIMQSFLDKFNPTTIKKHRTVHCLLFVGFANEQDYDNILAANKTVLGDFTLTIKPSENKIKEKEENDKKGEVEIDSEMDSQIDNLLQSIMNEEESQVKTGDGNENMKEEDKANPSEVVEVKDSEDETTTINGENTDTIQVNNDDSQDAFEIIDEVTDTENADEVQANSNGADNAVEIKDIDKDNPAENNENPADEVKNPAVEAVKDNAKATPKKSSTHVATPTPGTMTRRTSTRLNPN